MIELPEQVIQDLSEMKSTYSFVHSQGKIECWIHDLETKQVYAKAPGPTEPDAVVAAVKVAMRTEKPKSVAETLKDQSDEITRLKAQLAKLGAEPEAPPHKPKLLSKKSAKTEEPVEDDDPDDN